VGCKRGPRVLVIDNDPQVGRDLEAILTPRHCAVRVVRGDQGDLLRQAAADAQAFHPHIAVVDLRLRDDYRDERSGLTLLRELRSARCILYSNYLTPEVIQEANDKYGVSAWVGKADSPDRLVQVIKERARDCCARRNQLIIAWPQSCSNQDVRRALAGEDLHIDEEDVEDLLRQLLSEHKVIALERLGNHHGPFTAASRGRSVVLQVQVEGFEPVVLKLAPAKKIEQETKRHKKYVDGRLGGSYYAQLKHSAGFWDVGGSRYTFIGSSLGRPPTFSAFYRDQADPQVILQPLRHLFQEVWWRHYDRPLAPYSGYLCDLYDQSLHLKRRLRKSALGKQAADSLGKAGLRLINPLTWIQENAGKGKFHAAGRAVTHGDLHGDNLFVDGEHAWAIDFERTGPGHILRDFVELEVDIVTRLVRFPSEEPAVLAEFARTVAAPESLGSAVRFHSRLPESAEIRKALDVISGLRSLAHELTHVEDAREYLWGVLCDAVFVASLAAEGAVQHERALVLAAAVCERLA
jgi:ActR/RegA family two-component response regulator